MTELDPNRFLLLSKIGNIPATLRHFVLQPASAKFSGTMRLKSAADALERGAPLDHPTLDVLEAGLGFLQKFDKAAAEVDSHGKPLNSPGAKADAGKLLPDLVLGGFSRALAEVSAVGTYGAKKYTKYGWIEVPDGIERYSEALLRHWLKEKSGEECDPDTALRHAAHLAWNALARLDLMVREAEKETQQVHVVPADFSKATCR